MDLEKTDERPAQNNRYAACSQIINALRKYPDWETKFAEGDYGLLPLAKKFPNLRVVLLQVNPKEEWNGEYSLLAKIWGKWFTEMGISNYRFIKDDNVNEVKESIEKFMDVKVAGKLALVPWTKITTVDSSMMIVPEPVTKEELPPVVKVTLEKRTVAPAKTTFTATPEVMPPDESDASLLNGKKKDKPPVIKPVSKDNNDDILKDATLANGFNSGVKTTSRKKNRR